MSASNAKPEQSPSLSSEPTLHIEPEPQTAEPGEFYYEGSFMVFTEAYHQRRGYCCNSDCRHCPYR